MTKRVDTRPSNRSANAGAALILVAPYQEVADALEIYGVTHVVSILGMADRLAWPSVGNRNVLRLKFDDASYSSGDLVAPSRQHITDLIYFARKWDGAGTILVHCRAGTSRSPAAAMIVAASVGRMDVARQIANGKTYFRPHQGMLRLADAQLELASGLTKLAGSPPTPDHFDTIGVSKYPLR